MPEHIVSKLFDLTGKVAIITGGAGRLGRSHCAILRAAGARVISIDIITTDALDGVAEQHVVDIANRASVAQNIDQIARDHGSIDILINNAALNPKVGKDASPLDAQMMSPYEEYPEELWQKEIDIGLSGAQFCTQAVAPYMIKQQSGSIINITSTSAITAPDHRKYEKGKFKSVAYPTVKAALLGLTRAWASYFASVAPGVRVNALSLGAVNFGSMEPEFLAKLGSRNMLGRPARPDEYQGSILFLASTASEFITASNLIADGGQTAW